MWAELGERVYAEGKMMRGNLGDMRRKQGETKIPQSRGACGTRIVFTLKYNVNIVLIKL